jgi:hypothetical protein
MEFDADLVLDVLIPLCQEFGTEEIYNRIYAHVEELNND